MTLRVCEDCSCAYAVDLDRCPHCQSERSREQGDDTVPASTIHHQREQEEQQVAKISRHGGPSFTSDTDTDSDSDSDSDSVAGSDGQGGLREEDQRATTGRAEEDDHNPSPARPSPRDRKADWTAYATSLGLDPHATGSLNKDDLIAVVAAVEDGTHQLADDGTLQPIEG